MNPTQGQTQYYKTNFNGQTDYTAMPYFGNDPYGYTPISQADYVSGLQSGIQNFQNLQGQLTQGPTGSLSYTANGLSYQGTNPFDAISKWQQKLNEVQAGQGIHAAGYIDPTTAGYRNPALGDAPAANPELAAQLNGQGKVSAQAVAPGVTQNPDGSFTYPSASGTTSAGVSYTTNPDGTKTFTYGTPPPTATVSGSSIAYQVLDPSKLASYKSSDLLPPDANGRIFLKPGVTPVVGTTKEVTGMNAPTVNAPANGTNPSGSTAIPAIPAPSATNTVSTFLTGMQSTVDAARTAVENAYKTQLADLKTQQNQAQAKADAATAAQSNAIASQGTLAKSEAQQINDALAVQKQRIDDNYNANQSLIAEMDTLLTQGNDLISQQKGVTSLSAIKDPRVAQTMSDVAARAGVIQALLAAHNGQISVAESALASTVSAVQASYTDQINYYKTVADFYGAQASTANAKVTSITTDQKTYINAQIGLLEQDLKTVQDNANAISKAMIDPSTALAYNMAGVTLNDTPQQINQKLATYAYSKELQTTSNDMATKGYSAVIPGQKAPVGSEVVAMTDSLGKTTQYYKPAGGTSVSIQEYQFAVANGYKGTYVQYQNEDANRKAVALGSRSTLVMPNGGSNGATSTVVAKGSGGSGTASSAAPNLTTAKGITAAISNSMKWLSDNNLIGKDGHVSNETYLALQAQWAKQGGSITTFNTKMKGLVNPTYAYLYGVTK